MVWVMVTLDVTVTEVVWDNDLVVVAEFEVETVAVLVIVMVWEMV